MKCSGGYFFLVRGDTVIWWSVRPFCFPTLAIEYSERGVHAHERPVLGWYCRPSSLASWVAGAVQAGAVDPAASVGQVR
jgi:hypothetical protein